MRRFLKQRGMRGMVLGCGVAVLALGVAACGQKPAPVLPAASTAAPATSASGTNMGKLSFETAPLWLIPDIAIQDRGRRRSE